MAPARHLARATALLAVALVSACGDATSPSAPAPGNRSPRPQASIPSRAVQAGDTISVDVASFFTDPDGDPLTYAATTSDGGVSGASASGSNVTAVGVAEGTATITVTATDPGGLSARQRFTVDVSASSAFTALLERFIERNGIGAAALGIMRNGDIIYEGAAGFMDERRQVPVTTDVMMRIASVTKPITAAATAASPRGPAGTAITREVSRAPTRWPTSEATGSTMSSSSTADRDPSPRM